MGRSANILRGRDMNVEVKELKHENKKLKQALEEIREIISNYIKCFNGSCKDCLYYQECDICHCSRYHINKINEVLNE